MGESIEEYAAKLARERNSGDDADAKRAEQREVVLASLRNGSTISDAANAAFISRKTVWEWRNTDAEFAEAFEAARNEGAAAVEYEIAKAREDLRLKAIRALSDALDGVKMDRSRLTAAIFVAKAELGMVETQRVENVEIVPIVDDLQ